MSDVQRQDREGKEALIAWRAEVGAVRIAERAARLETEWRGVVALFAREWQVHGRRAGRSSGLRLDT